MTQQIYGSITQLGALNVTTTRGSYRIITDMLDSIEMYAVSRPLHLHEDIQFI
jgi:hypothetical protein